MGRLDRRLALYWCAAAIGSAVVGSVSLIPKVAAASGSSRILVIGDSLAHQIGWGLNQLVGRTPNLDVVNRGRASTGLVRDDFYDWPRAFERLLGSERFDVIVVSIGMNDRQNISLPGSILPRFSDDWRSVYGERVDHMMGLIESTGTPGFWMGMPIARSASFSRGMRVINSVFELVAANRPGIAYMPLWDLTTDANGTYTRYGRTVDGRTGVIRSDDGMHMTGFGSVFIAGHLLQRIEPVLQVATSP